MARLRKVLLEALEARTVLNGHTFLAGDVNCDGVFNSTDLVNLFQSGEYEDNVPIYEDGEFKGIKNAKNSTWEEGDFNGDRDFTSRDLVLAMANRTYETRPEPIAGDANLDGYFMSSDLTQVFQAGEYEDAIARNSNWCDGDWNGDWEFDSSDLVLAMSSGLYLSR